MDRLQSYGFLRSIEAESGRVTATISTNQVARDGWVIDTEGWDLSNYDRNPVVLWMHDDTGTPFARTVSHSNLNGELVATAEFDLEDPRGLEIFRKIQRGYINATSVRWDPRRWEWVMIDKREVLHFREQELLEWSFVTIPADPAALIARADGSRFDLARYRPTILAESPTEPSDAAARDEVASNASPSRAAIDALAERLASYIELRAVHPTVDDRIIRALAAHTGRDESLVRRMLAGGGSNNA